MNRDSMFFLLALLFIFGIITIYSRGLANDGVKPLFRTEWSEVRR